MKPHEHVIIEISRERERQMSVEGWTPEHDDTHSDGEMARAASVYAMTGSARWLCSKWRREASEHATVPADWPWALAWFKPKNPRADLLRAAALIVAEIERLDRIEKSKHLRAGSVEDHLAGRSRIE